MLRLVAYFVGFLLSTPGLHSAAFYEAALITDAGTPVHELLKLNLPTALPPVVEILSPTNGWRTEVSDAVPPLEISVRAFDPDGSLISTRVYLDGQPVATNTLSQFSVYPWLPTAEGEHHITALAEDHDGLLATNTVTFHVTQLPWPTSLEIFRSGEDLIIRYGGGRLQTSTDIRTWIDLPGPNPYTIPRNAGQFRFYRVAL